MATIHEVEETIWKIEGIRVVIRAVPGTDLPKFNYWERAAPDSWSLTEWWAKRLSGVLDGHDAIVIGASGQEPHGRTRLDNLRASYKP